MGKAGLGVGGMVIVLLVAVLGGGLGRGGGGGGDISDLLNQFPTAAPPSAGEGIDPAADPDRRLVDFVSFVFDDAQGFWADTFRRAGTPYTEARIVLFDQPVPSGCGGAYAETGPHYCPPDRKVYLDLGFFRELADKFEAPGDFAQAYVIAHELGHHVQNELGTNAAVRDAQQQDPSRANELSVRLELQADCYAGVWAHSAFEEGALETGDLAEGLAAAEAVGDDRIQERIQGRVNPESWTHGSAEQRQRWFSTGYGTGDADRCDTFEVASP